MTHPPSAPPASAPPGGAKPPAAPPPATATSPERPRRTALAEGLSRLRAATRTEPGRLRVIGAVVAGLLVAFGAVTAVQVADRSATADTVVTDTQPLSRDAAEIYRSLADANTMATTAFLAGTDDEGALTRYQQDIDRAGRLLAQAAAHTTGSGTAQELIQDLTAGLSRYTGLVETARANERQGFPIGGSYLRYADERMQQLLDRAERLYQLENERLSDDIDAAASAPWPALAVGVVTLAVLGWAQRRDYRRTNRVVNPGLLAATAAATVLFAWLGGAHLVSRGNLHDADARAARSLGELNTAWTEALKARADENMWLVARGAGDEFEQSHRVHMERMAGADGEGGLLGSAADLADDSEGRRPVLAAMESTKEWRATHRDAREAELAGDYDGALRLVIGGEDATGRSFEQVDASLRMAVDHEQRQFEDAAGSGHGALRGLAAGAVALAATAAVCALVGVGRRLAEYR